LIINTKKTFLFFVKILGGFCIARYFTRKGIRILCYHGVSSDDHWKFNGILFMRSPTFLQRMKFLKKNKYNVLSLERALSLSEKELLPPCPVVITADDGWRYTYTDTAKVANEFDFPLTVYVTSYYADAEVCVLNVVVRYLIWKSFDRVVDLSNFFSGDCGCVCLDSSNKKEVLDKVLEFVEKQPTLVDRKLTVERFAECLGFDGNSIINDQVFNLMSKDEIRQAAASGINIQLHTHRHRYPSDDLSSLRNEIEKNREILEPLVGKKLVHLCYPSGVFSTQAFDTLKKLNIQSAVTCEPGFVTAKTNRLALPRFLDGENISAIEFEAEMSGVLEIFRGLRSMLKRAFGPGDNH